MALLDLLDIFIVRILLLAVISTALYQYLLSIVKSRADARFGESQGCRPPTWVMPYRLPLALDILKLGFEAGRRKQLLGLFTGYFDELGPTVEVTILAGKGYATMAPENIETILSTRFDDFHLGPRNMAMKSMIGDGIFTQDGPAWKHSREVLRGNFVRMQYQKLDGFRDHVEFLIDTLSQHKEDTVDLQPAFFRLTLNTTIAMILGQPVESFNHELGDNFSQAFNKASLVTATRVRLGDMYWAFSPSGFKRACRTIKEYTNNFVQDALRDGHKTVEKETLIQDLHDEYRDPKRVRDQVLNVLIAGRDTTAATMAYAFRLLTSHPRTLEVLRNEISEVLGSSTDITRAQLQRMPYLQNVVKETLRLYPPVPINTRFCKKATTLPTGGGPDGNSPLLVREGMPVAYSVYHMQRRKDIYGADALEFRPERWNESEIANAKWAYLPFNGGPRVCLGKDFGLMLAYYGIARVIQAFPELRAVPDHVFEPIGEERQHLTLILSNADGCKVRLGPRAQT